jgi:hypothetical protein
VDELGLGGDPLASYGGRSLHEQSHGESFLAVMVNRFGPDGPSSTRTPSPCGSAEACSRHETGSYTS